MGDGDELDLPASATSSVDLEGRVDQDGALRPAAQQRVAGRVAAAFWGREERDASVLHIGPAHAVLPGRAVGSVPAGRLATSWLRRTGEPATPAATPRSAPPR